MPIWQYWQIKPCLYCLNKYTIHQQHMHQRQQTLSTYTASDVNWIHINQDNNLCDRCLAETENDPQKSIDKLEKDNQWSGKIHNIDITQLDKLEYGSKNYVAELLRRDSLRQLYGKEDNDELPSLLEIKSILVDQVDGLPADMIGRIKIIFIFNKVLFNINNVDKNNTDEQLRYLKHFMMIWKIISQKRVRSHSTYSGYTLRSDVDYTISRARNGNHGILQFLCTGWGSEPRSMSIVASPQTELFLVAWNVITFLSKHF